MNTGTSKLSAISAARQTMPRTSITAERSTYACGCLVEYDGLGTGYVAMCCVHAAGPELAEALREVVDLYMNPPTGYGKRTLGQSIGIARALLARLAP